ncbi:HSP20 family molecular chaperone IbpA [Dyadobacter sp. BE34]|jgi:HSP20 family molecular chaperone IbpA|uniref:HSP20 family molecular chaperone IbpA n=1 Tax=Dyadobacter fermentans TaxID=94254 RepID=A0ABU1R594_9BACT|nr:MULTISPECIES: Hsp20/alpha crystallin family protein [Dyadobacter]MBO9612455.1 Hsp20/alpha crystallin family protein [Dyadobacter sp.]MBZ1357060.1 Hsp20/alpha crystallin family protein [Dyadobacter fermentans]MDR6808115.1 HSP20 family molecular chaperone IbpA [Dyadobacter fermentans]MDR7046069.1 HSP20 family molecular chaperone IbpA [Dyadobacter sp. BE242]MDR7200382.1 HSP20 family molecular chaperone IbpA [Dyadobacter sp. BE34]
MESKLKIPREMLMNIDFINTVNGGMSEPSIKLDKGSDGFEVVVKIPGIEVEDLQLEVVKGKRNSNNLKLFHLLPIFSQENLPDEEQWKTIRFINTFVIPDGVDIDNISARYDDGRRQLVLFLPFGDEQGDYHRKVDIERW